MEAVACIDLGLSTEEFWRLNPRQFQALCKRRAYRDAQFICWYANFKRDTEKHPQPFTPEELMGQQGEQKSGMALDDTEGFFKALAQSGVSFGE